MIVNRSILRVLLCFTVVLTACGKHEEPAAEPASAASEAAPFPSEAAPAASEAASAASASNPDQQAPIEPLQPDQ